ncbi:hypothetical protein CFOL_v3_19614 [Cephalotus follicularis]|uniref:Uncharacterized protein n=1 Tax=Cephalotus follicularis TaxID=3775 RepID=A0A1Q3C7E4_CEPFO|nr:hypothetical protein CFOL_v3_19614 [Cephalotus follicularis]
MDAVELPYPVDVAAPMKLMGSERFGRARVTVKDVDGCDSIIVNPSIERCSTFLRHKDTTSAVTASQSASWDKFPDTEICRLSCQGVGVSEQLHLRGTDGLLSTSQPDTVQVQRKAGKVSRSNSGCSKRPRIAHLEDSMSLAAVDDVKDMSDGSYPTTCNSLEKSQSAKPKNSCSGKRGDRRNLKVPMRNKHDSFSMKGSLASFSMAAGGNNFFGVHGLKLDIDDLTKLVDDMSLNELLDGTFECPRLGKDKGKKAANMNTNILDSIRKAYSVLPHPRPIQSQNGTETDSSSFKKMPTFVVSGANGDEEDPCTTDPYSCNKDSCRNLETPANPLEFLLYTPKDIFERLALPQPKDLESLLLDAGKPTVFSRSSSDIRSSKQLSRRTSLPSFPWSHVSGHCRTNSDAVKFLASRSTCQGRWVRVVSTTISLGIATDGFTNLESLTYDQSLVPSGGGSFGILEKKIGSSMPVGLSCCGCGSSSPTTCSKASNVSQENADSTGEVKHQVNVSRCPKLVTAAQILFDIATHSPTHISPNGMKWPKKASQKVMEARKLKSIQKPEEIYAAMASALGSDNRGRSVDQIVSSKRPKLSTVENRKEASHTNCVKKGQVNGQVNVSAPRSSRPSPSKSVRDSLTESRNLTTNIVKQSYMLPPPARVSDRTCNSQQKLRKTMPLDWSRGRDRVD